MTAPDILERLNVNSTAVFLAAEAAVATELSKLFMEAATEIARLREELAKANRQRAAGGE